MNSYNVLITIENNSFTVPSGKYTGEDLYSLAEVSSDRFTLFLDVPNEIDVAILEENILIIKGGEKFVLSDKCSELQTNPHLYNPIPFVINGILYSEENAISRAKITTEELKQHIKNSSEPIRFILDIDGIADQVIPDSHEIVMGKNWRFLTTPVAQQDECVDIEDCCGQTLPPSHYYRIRINDEKYKVDVPHMLGRDILLLSSVGNPEQHALYQQFKGGVTKRVDPEKKVDFTAPGVERFTTIPLDMTEGLDLRRQFQLPDKDSEFLNSLQLPWEAVVESNIRRIIIHNFPLPIGYSAPTVMVNMRLEAAYPDAQIDMAYFFPAISRSDNKTIKATALDQFDSKQWQRWSRHRTSNNPWRPGIDNISTHLAAIESWLQLELVKKG